MKKGVWWGLNMEREELVVENREMRQIQCGTAVRKSLDRE